MKIALVKKRYSLTHGGSERYCVNLSRQLQKAGHAVTIVGEQIDEDLKDEVGFIPVPVNRMTSWTRNRSFAENCRTAMAAENFDIVYGLGRSFGLDAVRVTERLQSHWLKVNYQQPLQQCLQRWNPRHRTLIDLERAIYQSGSVRKIVTQSRLDCQLVSEYYGIPEEKIRIIYNGVDTTQFHPGWKSEREALRQELGIERDVPLLIFASMDFAGKGLHSIIQSLKNSHHSELHLLVLGSGPERKFAQFARTQGVYHRVVFAGRRNDIERCYGAGDLFILPTAYEPFPNVNLEAMACGLPVITTQTAGGADIILPHENGYLISNVNAVDEMTRWLNLYFDLAAEVQAEMSASCWKTAQQMTLEKNVKHTLELFEEVLHDKFRV